MEGQVEVSTKRYPCDLCSNVYRHKQSLNKHRYVVHPEEVTPRSPTPKSQDSFKCNVCEKSYSYRRNLSRHLRESVNCSRIDNGSVSCMKLNSTQKSFKCNVCEKTYPHRSKLLRHVKKSVKCSGTDNGSVSCRKINSTQKSFKCNVCEKSYSHRRNLLRHLRESVNCSQTDNGSVSCMEINTDNGSISCMEINCTNMFNSLKSFIEHLKRKHSMTFEEGTVTFNSEAEFMAWKYSVESDSKCDFPKFSIKSKGRVLYSYYRCHRSGLKISSRSKKVGHTCTAHMDVKEQTGKFSVSYNLSHYRHENELRLTRIPSCDKENIAAQLALGIPDQIVIDNIRNSAHGGSKRVHLITKKDIWNIRKKYIGENIRNSYVDQAEKHSGATSDEVALVRNSVSEIEDVKKSLTGRLQNILKTLEAVTDHDVIEKCDKSLVTIENMLSLHSSQRWFSVAHNYTYGEEIPRQRPFLSAPKRKRSSCRIGVPSPEKVVTIQNELNSFIPQCSRSNLNAMSSSGCIEINEDVSINEALSLQQMSCSQEQASSVIFYDGDDILLNEDFVVVIEIPYDKAQKSVVNF